MSVLLHSTVSFFSTTTFNTFSLFMAINVTDSKLGKKALLFCTRTHKKEDDFSASLQSKYQYHFQINGVLGRRTSNTRKPIYIGGLLSFPPYIQVPYTQVQSYWYTTTLTVPYRML